MKGLTHVVGREGMGEGGEGMGVSASTACDYGVDVRKLFWK